MLKIRMQRIGRINQPSYRIVVTEHTTAPKAGKFVEKLGTYNPRTKAKTLNTERIKYWIRVGAQPSGTMHNMFVTAGILSGKKINVLPKKTVAKTEEPVAHAAAQSSGETNEAAPEVAEVAAEAPAAETPAGE